MSNGSTLNTFCEEPFRLFFPIGFFFSLVGVSHWLWYFVGLSATYSCHYHALVQIQGFEMGFAVGFLMTALPRFLEALPVEPWELLVAAALLIASPVLLYFELWDPAEICFLLLIAHLSVFGLRRYFARQDLPPDSFLFLPFGLLHAGLGALLLVYPLPGFEKLGGRLLEQGTMLCFVMAIGPYLGPRLLASDAGPPDSPEGSRRGRYGLFGALLFLSFWVESGVSPAIGRALRALTITVHLLDTVPLWHRTAKVLWHLEGMRLAFLSLIAGAWCACLLPEYEIAALHLTFLGGFALLTFLVASRVISAHCGFESSWVRNTLPLAQLVVLIPLALVTRLLADAWVDAYFGILHIAAGFFLTGVAIWGAIWLPRLSLRHRDEDTAS